MVFVCRSIDVNDHRSSLVCVCVCVCVCVLLKCPCVCVFFVSMLKIIQMYERFLLPHNRDNPSEKCASS